MTRWDAEAVEVKVKYEGSSSDGGAGGQGGR